MPARDAEHFDVYTPQNQVKHDILSRYLPAYFNILKERVSAFHYIDGFAGAGTYGDSQPGSPLIVMQAADAITSMKPLAMSLVEASPKHAAKLRDTIGKAELDTKLDYRVVVKQGRFDEHVDELLRHDVYRSGSQVATFAFIDPCGMDGVRLKDIVRLLQLPFGEVLLFFNYDGVNRLAGAVAKEKLPRRVLDELFGAAASGIIESLRTIEEITDRESFIRDAFVDELKRLAGAAYAVLFRFSAKKASRTSHYLVHVTKHSLGFCLMKEQMYKAGRQEGERFGRLSFECDRDRAQPELDLVRPDLAQFEQRIIEELQRGPCPATTFMKKWVCRPEDTGCESLYRDLLLKLEREGRIVVFDKTNTKPCPADCRRSRKGESTLGADYYLHLRGQ